MDAKSTNEIKIITNCRTTSSTQQQKQFNLVHIID